MTFIEHGRRDSPARGRIARHTLWNLVGQGAPAVVAVYAIPRLVAGLGTERFGILLIGWTLMGYFGLFDLGVGRATTKFVAELIAQGRAAELRGLLRSSLAANLLLGGAGGLFLASLTPWLVRSGLKIPPGLEPEAWGSFFLLALSVPVIVLSSSSMGILEAMHRFDLTNAVRFPASALNYLAPLAVLRFSHDLRLVIASIVVLRVLTLASYFLLGRMCLPRAPQGSPSGLPWIRKLIGFGGWVIISTAVVIAVASVDRFVIGSRISLAAVTYYSTPYEMVTRLWILSGSLLGVLFPIFSSMGAGQSGQLSMLGRRAVRLLLIGVVPITAFLLAFAHELLSVWLGEAFAVQSTEVARWLVLGVLINIIAQVPLTILHGIGRADLTGKLQLALLACYVPAAWILAGAIGILGVAIGWTVRAAVENVLLFALERRAIQATPPGGGRVSWVRATVPVLFISLSWAAREIAPAPAVRLAVLAVSCAGFYAWSWFVLLDSPDRTAMLRAIGLGAAA
jgi:O-antigen/teichoic acid export membrane protein